MPFIGQQPTTGAFLELDSLTASATADYTLQLNGANYYPESVNNLLVSINGVIQGSSTMSLSGSTLTVGATLSASDVIDFVRVFGNVGTISTPTDGSVTANKIGTGAVTDAKIATMSSSKLTGALPSSVTSSGIYLGGTGSANLLDDYEEGTWTATLIGSGSNPSTPVTATCDYTKIGQTVFVNGQFNNFNNAGAAGGVRITGIPFTPNPGSQATGNVMIQSAALWAGTNTANISPYFTPSYIGFYASQSAGGWFEISHNATSGCYISFSGIYKV